MNDHTVTENITQEGTHISGHLVCSCGLSASITHNKKTSLTIAKARLRKLHDAPALAKEKTVKGSVLRKEKKPKAKITKLKSDEESEDFTVTLDDPDWSGESVN